MVDESSLDVSTELNQCTTLRAAGVTDGDSLLEAQLALFLAACVQRDVVDPVKLLNGEETRTTLMIRRLPRTITEADLYALLGPTIDCVYLPLFRGRVVQHINASPTNIYHQPVPNTNHQSNSNKPQQPLPPSTKNRGFGFVNFVSPLAAAVFVQSLPLYGDVFAKSEIVFAHVQGKHNMLNSPHLMNISATNILVDSTYNTDASFVTPSPGRSSA
jgi:hypothetical protein